MVWYVTTVYHPALSMRLSWLVDLIRKLYSSFQSIFYMTCSLNLVNILICDLQRNANESVHFWKMVKINALHGYICKQYQHNSIAGRLFEIIWILLVSLRIKYPTQWQYNLKLFPTTVSIGGIMGLFLGASILSAFEFIYFFFVRVCEKSYFKQNDYSAIIK